MRRGFLAAARPGPPPPPPPDESKCFVCGGRRSASDANADVRCFGAPACGSCARRWRVEAALRTCRDAQRLATRGRLAPYLGRFVEQFEGIRAAAPEQLDQLLDALRRNKAVGRRRPGARVDAPPQGLVDDATLLRLAGRRTSDDRVVAALRRWARTTPEGLGSTAPTRRRDARAARADRARPGSWTYANGDVAKIAAALVSGRGDALGAALRGPDGAVAPRAHVPRGDALRRAVGGGLARVLPRAAPPPPAGRRRRGALARGGALRGPPPDQTPGPAARDGVLRAAAAAGAQGADRGARRGPERAAAREGHIRVWLATVDGPADTMYAGGRFRLSLQFADDYPLQPPRVRFLTQVFHPNVDVASGAVCVDLLTDAHWTPAANVRVVLLSLQSLLADPTAVDAESPANAEAAALLKNDRPAFERRAQWTRRTRWTLRRGPARGRGAGGARGAGRGRGGVPGEVGERGRRLGRARGRRRGPAAGRRRRGLGAALVAAREVAPGAASRGGDGDRVMSSVASCPGPSRRRNRTRTAASNRTRNGGLNFHQ